MGRRSSRIQQVSERNEVRCMWGLFSILESCQGRPSQKMISNGRPFNRHINDYPTELHTIASFDQECRKIHNGAGVRSVLVEDKDRRVRKCIGADMHIEEHKRKYAKMDAELLDRVVKTHKRMSEKSSDEAYQSSSCCLNNAAVMMPSTSAEISLDKLTLTTILGAVCTQNQLEESQLSEYLQRNCDPGKYDQIDKINIQQVQIRAKAFVDQMFIERKFINYEPKSFSNSLEVLNSKKGQFMELLPDPNSTLARRFKNMNPSPMEKDTVKSILGANIECEGIDGGPSAKPGSALVMYKGNVKDKIVILKPKHSGNITCNCSSLQFPYRSDMKTASFSLREIKKKLKHAFGVAKREPSQLLCSSDKRSQDRSSANAASECICNGVDVRNSFSSSSNNRKKVQLTTKQELKSKRGSDIATTHRKLDFSSARYSNNQEFDVALKAKMHLSTRWNDLNSVEAVTSKNSARTLERILSSPEHDLWPFSPRRDGLFFSASAEMRFSPYNTSPRVIGCSPQVRPNTEVTSYDATESEARDSNTSTPNSMKINGESEIAEMNSFLTHGLFVSGEVPSETSNASITEPSESTKTSKTQKSDCSDSLTENKAVTSALDDFESTPWNSHNSDTAENIKYQEEHQSPVSVLEPFFVEDDTSLQNARKQLQPRRLDFEDCSVESFPYYQSAACRKEEEDHLCQYVQSVVEASCLDWDQLSEITSPPQELLHESLFDEVELPPLDCYYEPRLLFDRINEVLLEIYKFHLCFPPYATPKATLAEVVLDEIVGDAEFFILLTTKRRTLEQLVLKDVANSTTWLDIRHDSEHVAAEISEAVLDDSLIRYLSCTHETFALLCL